MLSLLFIDFHRFSLVHTYIHTYTCIYIDIDIGIDIDIDIDIDPFLLVSSRRESRSETHSTHLGGNREAKSIRSCIWYGKTRVNSPGLRPRVC